MTADVDEVDPVDPVVVADRLARFAFDQLEALVERHLPAFRVPGTFAGHAVGPDVRADLAFTLGLLWEHGNRAVAGMAIEDALVATLAPIDGAANHTFSSYRVAETLARFGPFASNPLLDGLGPAMRENLAAACDSSSWIELLDGGSLPRNYAAVLGRCELARYRLGLLDDDRAARALAARTGLLLTEHGGFLDDSRSNIGRYDIYTADIYLFTEPMAPLLGPIWRDGALRALELVEQVVTTDGTAVPWGRSTGALAACLTAELAGLALHERLSDRAGRWPALAAVALHHLPGWFANGLITAHQHRATYRYRGPARRLQMTLDCLGKLVASSLALRRAAVEVPAAAEPTFPHRDELIVFDDRGAGAWTYRSRDLAFVLAMVGGTVSDYLPAPHNPGLFEVPVDSPIPVGVPLVSWRGRRHTVGHRPARVDHSSGRLDLHHVDFPETGQLEVTADAEALAGTRTATYRVEGQTLHVVEELHFEEMPDAISLLVAETEGRPLQVRFDCPSAHTATVIDTSGMQEWRSFWAELPRVHQLDVEPALDVRWSWSVAPKLRVLMSVSDHHYQRSLYDPLADRVVERGVPWSRLDRPAALAATLAQWDQFHLHWPEWLMGEDLDRHRQFIAALADAGVRVIWTQHNLAPHAVGDLDTMADIYQAWAAASDGVIHHSRWGREQVETRYRFKATAEHRVIPHGHFGNLGVDAGDGAGGSRAEGSRAEIEAELGLTPGKLRLGVVGAPRAQKRVGLVMEAFLAAGRDDLELLVTSLGPDEVAPDHPGIIGLPYEMVSRAEYDRRLRCLDAVILPFDVTGMLTTGTVGDVVGAGLPAIASAWPFLTEVLGDAAITYGSTAEELTHCLRTLDRDQLDRAAAASVALQEPYDWNHLAEDTLRLLEAVGTNRL